MTAMNIDDAIAAPQTYGNPLRQHEIFSELRHTSPVHWTKPEGYRPFWTISKSSDIMEIERNAEIFLAAPRNKLWPIEFEEKLKAAGKGRMSVGRPITQMDAPDHKRYRQIAQDWFNPKSLKSLEVRMDRLAKRSMDDLKRLAPTCDFYLDIAQWYPMRVIMLILGLPEADEERLLGITRRYFAGGDAELADGTDYIQNAKEYFKYFASIAERCRKEPADDVASLIANTLLDGEAIDSDIASSYFAALASAGHDTTSSTAAGGVLAMIENPEQWELLRANPKLIPTAVEEMIRWVSPVKHFMRTAAKDYVLRGQAIRAGEAVLLAYPSANRDEEVFGDPWSFRVDRSPNRHVGFGFGPHICLGMFLARLELQVLFRELVQTVSRFSLAGQPRWVHTSFVGGLKTLPVHVELAA